jgi:hypothetical protein
MPTLRSTRLSQPAASVLPRDEYRVVGSIVGTGWDAPYGATRTVGAHTTSAIGRPGRALTLNGTSGGDDGDILRGPSVSTKTYTLLALIQFNSSSAAQSIIDRDLGTLRVFQFNRQASGALQVVSFDTSGNPYFTNTTSTVAQGVPAAVAARCSGAAVDVFTPDGAVASGTISNTPQSWDGVIGLGASWAGTATINNSRLDGLLYGYAVLPFAMTDGEIARFLANPWGLFVGDELLVPDTAGATLIFNPMTGRGGGAAQPLA